MITIAIVDDNDEIRTQLQNIFSLFDDIDVKFIASDGDQVIHAIKQLIEAPQVILMDIEMQRIGGIEATALVKQNYPTTKVVMLTASENSADIVKAFEAGADGYLLKGEKPLVMYDLIVKAAQGQLTVSDTVLKQTVSMLVNANINHQKQPADYNISPRELDVLKLLATGKEYQQIAQDLFISPQTVRSHIDNIYKKLGVHSKVEAANLVIKYNW